LGLREDGLVFRHPSILRGPTPFHLLSLHAGSGFRTRKYGRNDRSVARDRRDLRVTPELIGLTLQLGSDYGVILDLFNEEWNQPTAVHLH